MPRPVHLVKIIGDDKPETTSWWKKFKEKFPGSITLIISILTFYFGIVQFYYGQYLTDKRKYENDYYAARSSAFLELAKTTATIHQMIELHDTLTKPQKDSVRRFLATFDYVRFFLRSDTEDSLILDDIDYFKDTLTAYIIPQLAAGPRDNLKVFNLQRKLIQDAGNLFRREKDSINSFHFSLWPFH